MHRSTRVPPVHPDASGQSRGRSGRWIGLIRSIVAFAVLLALVAVSARWEVVGANEEAGDQAAADQPADTAANVEPAPAPTEIPPTVAPPAPVQEQPAAPDPVPVGGEDPAINEPAVAALVEPEPTTAPSPTPPVPTEEPAEPTAEPSPTPEPGGPTDLRVPASSAPSVEAIAGAEARIAIEIEHLGSGLADAKEFDVIAPAGWTVTILDRAGSPLQDRTGNGYAESAPLAPFQPEPLVVAVAIPADASAGTVAPIELRAVSTGDPSQANEARLSLSVVVLPPPSPSPSPAGEDASATPDATATATPTAPSEATPGATATAEPTSTLEPAEPAGPVDPAQVTLVLAGGDTVATEPGRWVDLPHAVTTVVVPAAASDPPVSISIDATSSAGWPVEIVDSRHPLQTTGGPYAVPADASSRQFATVTHPGATASIIVRVWIPEDAPDGATTDVTVSVRPISAFAGAGDDLAGGSDASLETNVNSVAGPVQDEEAPTAISPPEMVGFTLPADPASAHSVITVARSTALHIRGDGIHFGNLSPLGTGANPGIDVAVSDAGATYTQFNAVAIDVTSGGASWSVVCSVSGEGLVSAAGAARLEWRLSGTAGWHPISSEPGVCATGSGNETVELDVRYHVAWLDPPGQMSAEFGLELMTG